MHQIYQTNDSAKMCQVVKHSFLPLKKPRNSIGTAMQRAATLEMP